ncbi:MAG TPA: outer membrane beta-barrel protein [Burkholderiales bacterium]|nr:outer membrane beta-barrel protein [Burkholderiales bacterium]
MSLSRASLCTGILALAATGGLLEALDACAQTPSPPPGKALVILYRADRQPVAARVPVIANADRLGDIGNGEFVNAVVNPGRTFLRVGDRILTTLAIQTSAGRTSYVLIEAVPGLAPVRVDMREMSEASARRVLAQSRPAAAGPAAVTRAPAAAPPAAAPRPPRPAAPPPPVPAATAPPPPRQAQAAAPSPTGEKEQEEASQWRVAMVAKTGAFKLASTSQMIGGLQTAYDKSSKPVVGFETELRHAEGFAIGVEFLYYKNNLTAQGATLTGDQAVLATMANGKYYFGGDSGAFHPYLGAGIGFTGAKFGGDLTGKSSGPAYQGMVGLDLRFESVGLYLEYKYLNSTTQDSANQKIKVGGSGFLGGVSFAF